MTSKEALEELYNEQSYAYGKKVCNKGKEWNEAIENYYINYPFNHLKCEDETIESLEYCTKEEK